MEEKKYCLTLYRLRKGNAGSAGGVLEAIA